MRSGLGGSHMVLLAWQYSTYVHILTIYEHPTDTAAFSKEIATGTYNLIRISTYEVWTELCASQGRLWKP